MFEILPEIKGLHSLAGLVMVVFFLYVKYTTKAKVSVFGEKLGFIIALLSNATLVTVVLVSLLIVSTFDYLTAYLNKTGKTVMPIQINLPRISTEPKRVEYKKSFSQQILPEKRNADTYANYSYLVAVEENKPYYNSDNGLEFIAYNINVDKGTAQIGIGPSDVPTDSLFLLKNGGIGYHSDGKICTIYLVNAHSVGVTKYVTLQIQQ